MYREPGGKAEPIKEKLWHVLYLGTFNNGNTNVYTESRSPIIYVNSFETQEEMNAWLETNRQAANVACYTVCGHLAKVRVQTIHLIKTDPVTNG